MIYAIARYANTPLAKGNTFAPHRRATKKG